MHRPPTQLCYLLGPRFSEWLWTPETLCRVTPYQIVNFMAERMRQLYSPCTVWCAHANIGNEAALLVEHGFTVLCSEDMATSLCRRNLENAGLAPSLQLLLDVTPLDSTQWPAADVVVLNPPWGSGYERQRKNQFDLAELDVGGQRFLDLFDTVRSRYGNVVVLSPARAVPFDQYRATDSVLEFTKLRLLFYKKNVS